jgi:tRNA pseudouridine55 synthase
MNSVYACTESDLSVNGILIIDKPAGLTSHDVVARVRTIVGEQRVGHTGTLDPFATGVLVILLGRATRLAQFLAGADKEYEAVIRLGYATDTGDLTGKPKTEPQPISPGENFSRERIEAALASLRGEIEQTPPMYSAKKIGGRKLYELARRGEEVERRALRVHLRKFELQPDDDAQLYAMNDEGTLDLRVRVVCSAGTYVRVLAEDFGRNLGVGAHLAALRRTCAGNFKTKDAVSLERLQDAAQSNSIERLLVSPSDALSHLPIVDLNDDDARRVLHGIDLQIQNDAQPELAAGQCVGLRAPNEELIAIGVYNEERRLIHPAVVIGNP